MKTERHVVTALPGQGWTARYKQPGGPALEAPVVAWLVWSDGTVEAVGSDGCGGADPVFEASNLEGVVPPNWVAAS